MIDLVDTLGPDETDNVEWKRDGKDRDLIRKAICALANDLPARGRGHLLIGVRKDGTPAGLTIDEQSLLDIANIRDEARVLPRPIITVASAIFRGGACIHVIVEPARVRPIRFDGTVFVRIAASSRRASREEEVLLTERTRAADLPFDQQPITGSGIADLDVELFRSTYLPAAVSPEVLAENQRSTEHQLGSLHLLDPETLEARMLGLLILGFDPSTFLPGAYIQFVRYGGPDEAANVVDHSELRGNLIAQMDVLGHLLAAYNRTALQDVGGFRQEDQPDYPLNALRELILNAVMHRDYQHFNAPTRILWFDDRIEVTSPGGPYGAVTRHTFERRTDYRNPTLAAALKTLGYVNRFGRGIPLIRAALQQNGNPEPEFDVEDSYWSVTVRQS